MHTSLTHTVVAIYLLASVGVGLEVAFTAAANARGTGDLRLTGHSYAWMFPIYGLAYPLFALSWPVAGGLAWPVRGALYVVAIFAIEYAAGRLLRRVTGRCPWEDSYRASRWGIHGLIRLDYAAVWFVVALLFERLYLFLGR